ncbi:hypothetical protein JIN85_16665 [Luteolibacter pohnpeiensis]|uniref:Uncharacterized protein n=1 Tax=Luteolibacter pohnpeiensis TaxID=454153 RepID=A0A934SA31_9BACT|nr:hypothetical protein [Luteolibacter pohnpeiensis]MBK1884054.1 hypothetical protein [Luteolibacter pohnpeiensis]
MLERVEAADLVKELAFDGHSTRSILAMLEKRNWGAVLSRDEIDDLIRAARAAQKVIPARPSRLWPRAIGIFAMLIGVVSLVLNSPSSVSMLGRYSPGRYGVLAILLGLVLLIHPQWGREDV